MKKVLVLSIIFLITISVTGCWNSVELDKRAIVTAVGIDKGEKEDEIKLTVQILKPGALGPLSEGGGGGEESAVWVESSTGKTVFDAARNFTNLVSRKLNWEQNRVIVFGQAFAKEGVLPAIDYFLRDHESRKRAWVMFSEEEAGKVIEAQAIIEKIPADTINDLMRSTRATSTAPAIDLHHFALHLMNEFDDPYASRILIEDKEGKPGAALKGTAVLKKDQLVGWLDAKETRGLLWITNDISSGILVLNFSSTDKQIGLEIVRSTTKLKPKIVDGHPVMHIEINEVSSIGDDEGDEDMSDAEIIHSIAKMAEQAIEDEIQACLNKVQKELKADVVDFGTEIHRNLPKEWKQYKENWSEIYPTIQVEIDVTVTVDYTGFIKKIGAEN